jgi:hypothetical protein
MYSQGTLTITNSTISGNSTPQRHLVSGLRWRTVSHWLAATIRNSTISGNRAASAAAYTRGLSAGADQRYDFRKSQRRQWRRSTTSGTTGLYNVTVTQNQANADDAGFNVGGGISNAAAGTLTVVDSIIASNEVVIPTVPYPTLDVDDCVGTITSQGYNILEFVDASHCTVTGRTARTTRCLGRCSSTAADPDACDLARQPGYRRGQPVRLHRRPRRARHDRSTRRAPPLRSGLRHGCVRVRRHHFQERLPTSLAEPRALRRRSGAATSGETDQTNTSGLDGVWNSLRQRLTA